VLPSENRGVDFPTRFLTLGISVALFNVTPLMQRRL
jgi:hypothetical protein